MRKKCLALTKMRLLIFFKHCNSLFSVLKAGRKLYFRNFVTAGRQTQIDRRRRYRMMLCNIDAHFQHTKRPTRWMGQNLTSTEGKCKYEPSISGTFSFFASYHLFLAFSLIVSNFSWTSPPPLQSCQDHARCKDEQFHSAILQSSQNRERPG